MAKQKNNYFVVWNGEKTGIFESRSETEKNIKGFSNAKYKGFKELNEAKIAFEKGPDSYYKKKESRKNKDLPFEKNSIAVDAACSGNPGKMEYQGIDLQDGKQLFHEKFNTGTNNIGEFLALVHGLSFLKQSNSPKSIYSDSKHAISWIENKKCKTKLKKTENTKQIYELINRAEERLKNNNYTNKILKRNTKDRGEIPADFGRK